MPKMKNAQTSSLDDTPVKRPTKTDRRERPFVYDPSVEEHRVDLSRLMSLVSHKAKRNGGRVKIEELMSAMKSYIEECNEKTTRASECVPTHSGLSARLGIPLRQYWNLRGDDAGDPRVRWVLEWFDAYVESRLLEAASQNRVDGKVAEIIAKNRLGFDKNATSKDKMTVNIEFVPVSSKADVAVVEGSKEMEDIEAKSIAEVEDIMGKSPEDEMVGLVLDQRGYEHTVDELLKPGMFDKEKPSSSGKDEFDKVLEELM